MTPSICEALYYSIHNIVITGSTMFRYDYFVRVYIPNISSS